MSEQDTSATKGNEPSKYRPPAEVPKPESGTGCQPAADPNLAKIECELADEKREMSGFERATLRWTIASFVVILFTCLFIALQWNEMRSGGQDTHDLAVAAKKQAEGFGNEQRAWVGVGDNKLQGFDAKTPFQFILPFTNTGKTPAIKTVVGISWQFSPVYQKGPPEHAFVFAPTAAIALQGHYTVKIMNTETPKYWKAINEKKMWFYLFGQFRYSDISSPTVHTTSFCMYYDRDAKIMAFCQEGNDMN